MNTVAIIRQIARYPVKSMRGELLSNTMVGFKGIADDRRYAFVQTESRSDFPWLTARQMPELLLYKPALEEVPGETWVGVTTPRGKKWPVDSVELRCELEKRSRRPLFLLRQSGGSYDAAPISLISCQTVAQIAAESETPEDFWRFRPNLVMDLQGGESFGESKWVGRILRIGTTARIAVTKLDGRCMLITLDPQTGAANPAILRSVAQQHDNCAGVYGAVLTAGEVRVGDEVSLEK